MHRPHGISGTAHGTLGTESRSNGNTAQGISGTVRRYYGNALNSPTRDESMSRVRSEEHTSELQSLMRISYAVFCLKKKKKSTVKQMRTNTTFSRIHDKYKLHY